MTDTLPRQLMDIVLKNTQDGVAITDRQNRIVFVNQAFSNVTGYTAEEAIGQNPRILSSGKHPESFYRDMWATLAETGFWQGEIWDKRKNGEVYLEYLSITAISDASGDISNYIAVFTDINHKHDSDRGAIKHAGIDDLTEIANRSQLNPNC